MNKNQKPLFGPGGNSAEFLQSKQKSSVFAPKWVKDYGLDCYEYQCGNGVTGSDENFIKIGERAKEEGVILSLHAPYYISLSGVETEKRLGSIKYILQSLNAAKLMGAYLIVIHAGSTAKLERADAMRLAADTVFKAVSQCEEVSRNGVMLGLETMGKINQLGTVEEIIELCKIDKSLVPVVDFGHLYARSRGTEMAVADSMKSVFDRISTVLGAEYAENLHCHFSKIQYTDGGEQKHLTFENTEYGPSPLIFSEVIRSLGVNPTVICESAGTMDKDALILKNLYYGEK